MVHPSEIYSYKIVNKSVEIYFQLMKVCDASIRDGTIILYVHTQFLGV